MMDHGPLRTRRSPTRPRAPFVPALVALALAACMLPAAPARAAIAGCSNWSVLAADTRPVGGYAPALVYDSVRDRMVAYGLSDERTGDASDRVVAMGLAGAPAWVDLTPAVPGPGARYGQCAVYDPVRDRMLVLGPSDTSVEVWALNFATGAWAQVVAAGAPPSHRSGQVAIYDSGRDRIVLFGGIDDGGAALADAWALNLAGSPAWTLLAPAGLPPLGRYSASAIYDSPRNRMIVFGGMFANGRSTEEAWSLSLGGSVTWSKLTPGGTPPTDRYSHAAIFDSPRNRMIVFGGSVSSPTGYSGPLNDVWALALSGTIAWTRLNPAGATYPAVNLQAAFYDPVRQALVSFGGNGASLGEVWSLPLAGTLAWSEVVVAGQPPMARNHPLVVCDAPRARAVMVEGTGPFTLALNDVWAFALGASPGWSRILPTGAGPVRRDACGALDSLNSRILLFGGHDGQHEQNDVWALSLAGTPAWTKLSPTGTPPLPRHSATAVVDPVRNRMLVLGGLDSTGMPLGEIWALSLAGGGAWSRLTWAGEPLVNPAALAAAFDRPRDRVLLVAGASPNPSDPPSALFSLTFTGVDTLKKLLVAGAGQSPWAVLDPLDDRLLIGTGSPNPGAVNLTGTPAWEPLNATEPVTVEDFASAIWDAASQRVVTFCGTQALAPGPANVVRGMTPCGLTAVPSADATAATDLKRLYPNPGRLPLRIGFSLARAGRADLAVFDLAGRRLRTLAGGDFTAGEHTLTWSGATRQAEVKPGVYFVRLSTPDRVVTRRIVMIE